MLAAQAGERAVRGTRHGQWVARHLSGGTGVLLHLVSDDGTHDFTRQRRAGREPLSDACQCPAALSGGRWRLYRRVLPVPRHLESDAPDGCTREVRDRRDRPGLRWCHRDCLGDPPLARSRLVRIQALAVAAGQYP